MPTAMRERSRFRCWSQLDLTIPEKPAVPARDGSTAATSDEPGSFSGTAEPGARIVLRSDRDGVVGEAVADENGNWEIVVDTLSVNTHALTVTATDAAGNESPASDPLVLNVVQQASERQPAAPVDLASLLSGFRDNVPANDGGTAIDSGASTAYLQRQVSGRQLQIAGRDKAMSDLMRGAA